MKNSIGDQYLDKCIASDQCEELQGQAHAPTTTLSHWKQQSLYFPAEHKKILSSTAYVNALWKDQYRIKRTISRNKITGQAKPIMRR